jgi:C_GCAxxG_C_C family probable redox protein
MSVEQQARRNFNSGFNCAESVLLVLSRQLRKKMKGVGPAIPRIATGFGGGVGRNGDICGALAGGVMALGLALGRDRKEQSRDPCYSAVDRFYSEFVRKFGTCRCSELTGVDLKTPDGLKMHQDRIHTERCSPIVAWAAENASRIIGEASGSR